MKYYNVHRFALSAIRGELLQREREIVLEYYGLLIINSKDQERERKRQRNRERQRERERQSVREREGQKETERETDRERQREREQQIINKIELT